MRALMRGAMRPNESALRRNAWPRLIVIGDAPRIE